MGGGRERACQQFSIVLFLFLSWSLAIMAKQSAFAGAHTVKKLNAIEDYLRAYQNVMKNTNFETIFFDAFAGTGELPVNLGEVRLFPDLIDKNDLVEGSAKRALQIEPPFHKYIFVEKMKGKAEELAKLAATFANISHRVRVDNGDANERLIAFCQNTNWSFSRAVVFLDPFGNQVRWQPLWQLQSAPLTSGTYFPRISG
jgi:three-Cys-motif partner protein